MVVGAILMVGGRSAVPDKATEGSGLLSESAASQPLAGVEVLGESILQRAIRALRHDGADPISVIADHRSLHTASQLRRDQVAVKFVRKLLDTWFAVEYLWGQYIEHGVQVVLLWRLGAYVEFSLPNQVRFLREHPQQLIRLADSQGPLDFWVFDVDGARGMQMGRLRGLPDLMRWPNSASYRLRSYVNRLESVRDLRRLVIDAFRRVPRFAREGGKPNQAFGSKTGPGYTASAALCPRRTSAVERCWARPR